MSQPTKAGTVTKQQLDGIRKRAPEAKVTEHRHLLVLAMAERNRSRAWARKFDKPVPPPLHAFGQLSMYEASNLIALLEDHAGGPPPTTCARCARIGFEPQEICMHDRPEGRLSSRDEAVAERERMRGRRSW